jgi:DNA-binding NarL/FixJ family response regulator
MSQPDILAAAESLMRRHGIEPGTVRNIISKLRADYGGGQVYVRALDRPARDAEIKNLLDKGVSVEGVARFAKTSVATVRRKKSQWL